MVAVMPTSFTKLDIVQKACALCGENIPAVEDDGSPEWDVASARYDLMLPVFSQRHAWNFNTASVALAQAGSNPSQDFLYAYVRPAGAVRIVNLWSGGARLANFSTRGGVLAANVAPSTGLTADYLTVAGPEEASAVFVLGLIEDVQAAIYRGLQEDASRADMMEEKAKATMNEAKRLNDQEAPARDTRRGRIAERRRGRVILG
jgi:hypothetical protein